jgi:hypothetical protein
MSLITFSSGLPSSTKPKNNNIEYPKCDEQISNTKKSNKFSSSCQNTNDNVWIYINKCF